MHFNIKTLTGLRGFLMLAILSLSTSSAIAGYGVPIYDPGFWNVSSRVYYNNCYNYATNEATNTFAQPGRAYFGYNPIKTNTLSCTEVRSFAALDGTLQKENGTETFLFAGYTDATPCPSNRPARLALVVAPGIDYHWYRLDNGSGGRWSHKQGKTNAKDVDDSGQAIYSIEAANRGRYTQVCGYFCSYSGSTSQDSGQVWIN
jgi:hypothetical protein